MKFLKFFLPVMFFIVSFTSNPATVSAFINVPFGGLLLASFPCTCGSRGVYLIDYDFRTKLPALIKFDVPGSILSTPQNVASMFTPMTYNIGTFTPVGVCGLGSEDFCFPLPAMGTVTYYPNAGVGFGGLPQTAAVSAGGNSLAGLAAVGGLMTVSLLQDTNESVYEQRCDTTAKKMYDPVCRNMIEAMGNGCIDIDYETGKCNQPCLEEVITPRGNVCTLYEPYNEFGNDPYGPGIADGESVENAEVWVLKQPLPYDEDWSITFSGIFYDSFADERQSIVRSSESITDGLDLFWLGTQKIHSRLNNGEIWFDEAFLTGDSNVNSRLRSSTDHWTVSRDTTNVKGAQNGKVTLSYSFTNRRWRIYANDQLVSDYSFCFGSNPNNCDDVVGPGELPPPIEKIYLMGFVGIIDKDGYFEDGNYCANNIVDKFLWKPISESDGNLVVLYNGYTKAATVVGPNGNTAGTFEIGNLSIGAGTENGYDAGTRFSKPGSSYPDGSRVILGDTQCLIPESSERVESCISPTGIDNSSNTNNCIPPTANEYNGEKIYIQYKDYEGTTRVRIPESILEEYPNTDWDSTTVTVNGKYTGTYRGVDGDNLRPSYTIPGNPSISYPARVVVNLGGGDTRCYKTSGPDNQDPEDC